MESLDQQIKVLIEQAPQDGITATLVRVIAPLLKQMASQLRHHQYYVLQTLDAGWIVTTLSNRTKPELEKSVIYAFPTYDDAQRQATDNREEESLIIPIPIIHILFRLIALQRVDSAIFFESKGDSRQGIEIRCDDLQRQVQAQIAAYQAQLRSTEPRNPPPDIA